MRIISTLYLSGIFQLEPDISIISWNGRCFKLDNLFWFINLLSNVYLDIYRYQFSYKMAQ